LFYDLLFIDRSCYRQKKYSVPSFHSRCSRNESVQLFNWLKKSCHFVNLVRSETKINRDAFALVFLRFASAACIGAVWLVLWFACVLCDWPEFLRPWQTRTHCCGHIVADTNVSPFAYAGNICCGHKFCVRDTKNVFDFVQKHFVSATNVSQFAQPKKHHEQQCVLNNVFSFARAFNTGFKKLRRRHNALAQPWNHGSWLNLLFSDVPVVVVVFLNSLKVR